MNPGGADLFFDCGFGISGDMTLGALLDLGVPLAHLRHELHKLPIRGYTLRSRTVERHGVRARKLEVALDEHHRDNCTERLYGEIVAMIESSALSPFVRGSSLRLLEVLACAEAAAHGVRVEEISFHEKGAVDTIVDFVGAAVGMEYLSPARCLSTPLSDGTGFIQCRRGVIPVPVPAVQELTRTFCIPVNSLAIESELVTPTGAAIAAVFFSGYLPALPHSTPILRAGAGAGDYDYGTGGYLKCSLLQS